MCQLSVTDSPARKPKSSAAIEGSSSGSNVVSSPATRRTCSSAHMCSQHVWRVHDCSKRKLTCVGAKPMYCGAVRHALDCSCTAGARPPTDCVAMPQAYAAELCLAINAEQRLALLLQINHSWGVTEQAFATLRAEVPAAPCPHG